MKILKKFAYSKINLGLKVPYKRKDGYHEINSIFIKISLSDEIIFEESNNFELIINSLELKSDDISNNLIYKALKLIEFEIMAELKVKITLNKQIPIGAGLGGGSSDAAATLLGLNEFFNLQLSDENLYQMACKLGSDVPFFLKKGFAQVNGRGEILSYFNTNLPFKVLIVNPGIHISTPKAYGLLNRTDIIVKETSFKDILLSDDFNPLILKDLFVNDFEDKIFEIYPKILQIKNGLYENGAIFALMSGSGSSVFGLFDSDENLKKAQMFFPDYFVAICDIIED